MLAVPVTVPVYPDDYFIFLAIRKMRVIEALQKLKKRRGVEFIAFSYGGTAQTMNWSCKAISYSDDGYEI